MRGGIRELTTLRLSTMCVAGCHRLRQLNPENQGAVHKTDVVADHAGKLAPLLPTRHRNHGTVFRRPRHAPRTNDWPGRPRTRATHRARSPWRSRRRRRPPEADGCHRLAASENQGTKDPPPEEARRDVAGQGGASRSERRKVRPDERSPAEAGAFDRTRTPALRNEHDSGSRTRGVGAGRTFDRSREPSQARAR